jgi:hypothetical protein
MDFIEGLPRSGNFDCILVVIDKFIRYGHFVPLSHPYSTQTVASVFMNVVYKLHGLPASIVSDRDPIFTSKYWQDLFKLSGTSLKLSSSYHPQTDGQTEWVNQCLETYLGVLCTPVQGNGRPDWLLLNFGTILAFIVPWADLHLSVDPPAVGKGKLET